MSNVKTDALSFQISAPMHLLDGFFTQKADVSTLCTVTTGH